MTTLVRKLIPLVFSCIAAVVSITPIVLAHSTGTEARNPNECDVLPGTALAGARGECLRCIQRAHYHYHPELPRRQRCHRETFNPDAAARRRHHH